LRNDQEFLLELIKQNYLVFVSQALRGNREFALQVLKENRLSIDLMTEWKHDKQFMLQAVKQDGQLLEHAEKNFQKDDELILEAAKECGFVFEFSQRRTHQVWLR